MLSPEHLSWSRSRLLVGIDEVGRGPLAGPVVAAAVVFPAGHGGIDGVRDSKQVKRLVEREALSRAVRRVAVAVGVGAASVAEIEQLNIRRATALAMSRALQRCTLRISNSAFDVVIDGLSVPELGVEHRAIVKGDANCHSIAAASIVAKVCRDRWMRWLDRRHPGYGWNSNVGYGSAAHMAAIVSLGMTPQHRPSFCQGVKGEGSTPSRPSIP